MNPEHTSIFQTEIYPILQPDTEIGKESMRHHLTGKGHRVDDCSLVTLQDLRTVLETPPKK